MRWFVVCMAGMLAVSQGALAVPSTATCAPTPAVKSNDYPGAQAIAHGNNLLKAAGKPEEVSGVQKIMIQGTVRDAACMPVSDVWIQLWQLDPFGKLMRATDEDLVTPDPVFVGTGRALTGPDGKFTFITAFPGVPYVQTRQGRHPQHAPRVFLTLRPTGMKPLTTALYFEKDVRNAKDAVLQSLKPEQREALMMRMDDRNPAALQGNITIVLPQKAKYQAY